MAKVIITLDLTKVDSRKKQLVESNLVGRGRFTVDSISESTEVFSLDIPEKYPSEDQFVGLITRRFSHILGQDATITKSSS